MFLYAKIQEEIRTREQVVSYVLKKIEKTSQGNGNSPPSHSIIHANVQAWVVEKLGVKVFSRVCQIYLHRVYHLFGDFPAENLVYTIYTVCIKFCPLKSFRENHDVVR